MTSTKIQTGFIFCGFISTCFLLNYHLCLDYPKDSERTEMFSKIFHKSDIKIAPFLPKIPILNREETMPLN